MKVSGAAPARGLLPHALPHPSHSFNFPEPEPGPSLIAASQECILVSDSWFPQCKVSMLLWKGHWDLIMQWTCDTAKASDPHMGLTGFSDTCAGTLVSINAPSTSLTLWWVVILEV